MTARLQIAFLGLLLGGGLVWLRYRPTVTDGFQWVREDTCVHVLQHRFPFRNLPPLQPGDRLLRIDYQPACHLAPFLEHGQSLRLYEIVREGTKSLVFAELRPYPSFGWFARVWQLQIGIGLGLILFVGGVLVLSLYVKSRVYQPWPLKAVGVWFLFLLQHILLFAWVVSAYEEERIWLTAGLIGVQGLWYGLRHIGVGLMLSGVGLGAAWVWPSQMALVYGLVSGGMGLLLSGWQRWVYMGTWGIWIMSFQPTGLWLLQGVAAACVSWSHLGRAWRLLTERERAFYLMSIGIIGGGASIIAQRFMWQEVWEIVGLHLLLSSGAWIWVEGLRRLDRSRRRLLRRRVLEAEIPVLWEVPDAASLERKVAQLLATHWDIPEARIVEDTAPQRLWLLRTGEPAPNPAWQRQHTEVAIPIGEPYWLLIGSPRYPLTTEELGWLSSFGRFVGISRRHLALYEAAHEARLQALRHQLSPHFLFNALHTLQGLLYEDAQLAEKLLSHLGQLLRRSLELAKHLLVPLAEEISLVRDYLEVERQRYGKRLIVDWRVPDPMPEALIPPFSVQTLVENAIKHAVAKQSRPTTLRLSLEVGEAQVTTIVSDDGPGLTAISEKPGIGLSNLSSRLEKIYGSAATLQLHAMDENQGVTVVLSFPRFPQTTPPGHSQSPASGRSSHDE